MSLRKQLLKLAKKPVVYNGEDPFKDLVYEGLVSSFKNGLVAFYIRPDNRIACRFRKVKPWTLFEELYPMWFDMRIMSVNDTDYIFLGGHYEPIIKRVVRKIV